MNNNFIRYLRIKQYKNIQYYIGGFNIYWETLEDVVLAEILEITLQSYQSKMVTEFNAIIQFDSVFFNNESDCQKAFLWVYDTYHGILAMRKLMGENILDTDKLTFDDYDCQMKKHRDSPIISR